MAGLKSNIMTISVYVILQIIREVKRDVKLKALEKNRTVFEHYIKSLDVQVDLWELVTHAEVREEDDNDEGESGRGCDEDRVHTDNDEDG